MNPSPSEKFTSKVKSYLISQGKNRRTMLKSEYDPILNFFTEIRGKTEDDIQQYLSKYDSENKKKREGWRSKYELHDNIIIYKECDNPDKTQYKEIIHAEQMFDRFSEIHIGKEGKEEGKHFISKDFFKRVKQKHGDSITRELTEMFLTYCPGCKEDKAIKEERKEKKKKSKESPVTSKPIDSTKQIESLEQVEADEVETLKKRICEKVCEQVDSYARRIIVKRKASEINDGNDHHPQPSQQHQQQQPHNPNSNNIDDEKEQNDIDIIEPAVDVDANSEIQKLKYEVRVMKR